MEADEKLIERANKGEAGAFEELYYKYRDWVYRLAYRFCGDRELALDVLQDTFIYFLKRFPGFRLTASMTTFLYPTVKHFALNAKSKKRRLGAGSEWMDCEKNQVAEGEVKREELAAVLAGLPEEQRELLLMRFVEDMTIEEISQALRKPVGTIKSRLYNALKALRGDSRIREYFLE